MIKINQIHLAKQIIPKVILIIMEVTSNQRIKRKEENQAYE